MRGESQKQCKIMLNGQIMKEFKYLGSVLCKYGEREKESSARKESSGIFGMHDERKD